MTTANEERFNDPERMHRAVFGSAIVGIWTAMPGYIISFDPVAVTASVQLGIRGQVLKPDGSVELYDYKPLVDVPVVFPHGGDCTLTFPVEADDECLVMFASRSIDAWWQNGGIQAPSDARTHSLTDGFVLLGPMSQANKISNISTTTTQLRSDDGQVFIELNADTHAVVITTPNPGSVTVNSELIQFNGNLGVSENVTVGNGASGTFTTPAGQVITVQDGIVTNIY